MGAVSVETQSGNCRLSYVWTNRGTDLNSQQRIFGFGADASCNTYSIIDFFNAVRNMRKNQVWLLREK